MKRGANNKNSGVNSEKVVKNNKRNIGSGMINLNHLMNQEVQIQSLHKLITATQNKCLKKIKSKGKQEPSDRRSDGF